MFEGHSEDLNGTSTWLGIGDAALENYFGILTFRYLPPSRLAAHDMSYEQGLDRLVYIQTLIEEE